ncbi:protein Mpv17 [Diprion similis]|uniref:protein Mpv17 n=1 Tax=Diprion similis TaxID=362088 RepID=UPI001EF8C68D|nr:protein Mpv17 [Diprion similis]
MSGMVKLYQKFLRKYPLCIQSVQAGILMGTGDQIAQNFVERRKIEDLNFMRSAQFFCIGCCLAGPATKTWYGILERYIGSKNSVAALKKVVLDQGCFAPVFVAVLLTVIATMQGNDIEGVKTKLKSDYTDILSNNYKLWPMVQLANFYFVRLEYQVLVVQTVALFWNTYISYRTNRDVQGTHKNV